VKMAMTLNALAVWHLEASALLHAPAPSDHAAQVSLAESPLPASTTVTKTPISTSPDLVSIVFDVGMMMPKNRAMPSTARVAR